uniref:Predicted protein n=1 Tax=Hordeum vulgare subsp. vulgare TaxID=112509 RepID=F2E3D4_HORVV|nr:predicted protein [Hordeum vulgare subsp. vulgare]
MSSPSPYARLQSVARQISPLTTLREAVSSSHVSATPRSEVAPTVRSIHEDDDSSPDPIDGMELRVKNPLLKKKYCAIAPSAHVVFIGFGSVGQGTLPLLFRHFQVHPSQVFIVTKDKRGADVAKRFGVQMRIAGLTAENYEGILTPLLTPDSFVVNVSVEVSTVALMQLCIRLNCFYLDTCTEPWGGTYDNPKLSASERSNYALRLEALSLAPLLEGKRPSIMTHGANPGLVSHLTKQALLNVAKDTGFPLVRVPQSKQEWACLARDLGIKVIHIAERDTQVAFAHAAKKPHEFVNTWSCDGFISEGCYQVSELGWGTHEKHFPTDGMRHQLPLAKGQDPPAICLSTQGGITKCRSWTPHYGPYVGFIVTHAESISIADFLTVKVGDTTVYRPTVNYAYHPCDYAVMSVHEMQGRGWIEQKEKRVLGPQDIRTGIDELGVLLMGHKRGAYWYGSQLSIEEAKRLAPYQNATGLQVTAPIIAAMIWAYENPSAGLVEPDDMDFSRILSICSPYLGKVTGCYTDWTPLKTRGKLCTDPADFEDPWQFQNFRI